MFQSRNRESSNFNKCRLESKSCLDECFNLVIENLLISTLTSFDKQYDIWGNLFQSRNRESSNFNS